MTPSPQAADLPARPASAAARASAWLAATASDWTGTEGERWLFVARTIAAAFGALWLAYRLGLDSPSTAMTTTLIVALPSAGMVLEKSFYRLLGTLVGCSAALAMIGMFPQTPVLLFACLALWVGLCTSGSALNRNAQSYSFVLSGYTACLIVLPAVDQPTLAFSLAVTRASEIGVGILCSAIASAVLLPRHQSTQVMRSVDSRYARFTGFCHAVLRHQLAPADAELAQLQFAADIAALESGRSAAIFEVIHARDHHRQLHAFNLSFMQALTTFYTLQRLQRRIGQDRLSALPALTEPLYGIVADALGDGTPLAELAQPLRQALLAARQRIAAQPLVRTDSVDFDTSVELLQRFVREMSHFQDLYQGLLLGRRRDLPEAPAYVPKTPSLLVLAGGLRAAATLVLLLLAAYYLDWPYAATAILMATVFNALAAASPRPFTLITHVLAGFVLGWPVALACVFFVMPQAQGFTMLMLALAPFLAGAVYLISDPKRSAIGLGLGLFVTQFVPANVLYLDGAAFMNTSLALIAGVALSWLIFALLLPRHTIGQKDHVAAALWAEALAACTAAPRHLKHRFNSRVRDLLSQLNAAAGPAPGEATLAVVRQALTLLELGNSVIDLRALIAGADASLARSALQDCVSRIAAYLRAPAQASCSAAVEAILQAGLAVRAALPGASAERQARLHATLIDMHSIYTSLLDQLPQVPGDPNRAA
ncbi:FUSC family protein [Janthinobacterium agaricidamnosum]|uniref:Fusaric acid resistance conserved region family protein n=1 Tax=Janthinobacterium agaricidamnosum NBRC 102515 = DSM 9628 TaxID=1349767 RepID=W0V9U3_9BURK|nr:FUSC family protein [Janthinobacterium agaricidamnosum]CDG84661.1 fusaric acid resistance conserved region family protein [Janthinobacterium agaricidamnosum NBRC 102515 = DSM 9628]